MCDRKLREFVFARRGELLAVPAAALALLGKPSAFSIAAGLPFAFAGEALRCWAVGYSGVTTRADQVTAPALVTAGPYAYLRNPLYAGNFITAAGFAYAFTGDLPRPLRRLLIGASLAALVAVYAVIVPHEEAYLRERFGPAFEHYSRNVPAVVPRREPYAGAQGTFDPAVIAKAETRTFATFGVMLAALALRALRA
jgi:protein-S-isoprenylcysteine O-methyltransferase Ste14